MKNIAGSPVEGADFFGRDAVVAYLLEVLLHDDVLLLGPRRIGKTSVARAVMALAAKAGWRVLEINVAACMSERDFLKKLDEHLRPQLDSLGQRALTAVSTTLASLSQRIDSVKIPVPGAGSLAVSLNAGKEDDWLRVASDLVGMLAVVEENWLLYIDELPIMLFNIIRNDPDTGAQRVRRFLDWFRNDVRALPGAAKLRWLVSGSVGLDTLVQEHGMADTINSFNHQGLAPFSNEVAVSMLQRLAEQYALALSATDLQKIVSAVQWPQPYYLQLTFHHLRSLLAEQTVGDIGAMVDLAINQLVEPGSDNDFHHWETRLSLQLNAVDAKHAMALLNLAARDQNGVRAERLLAVVEERMPQADSDDSKRTFIRLRDILLRDAYWWADSSSGAKRYRFRLEPLRRWWLRRDEL